TAVGNAVQVETRYGNARRGEPVVRHAEGERRHDLRRCRGNRHPHSAKRSGPLDVGQRHRLAGGEHACRCTLAPTRCPAARPTRAGRVLERYRAAVETSVDERERRPRTTVHELATYLN